MKWLLKALIQALIEIFEEWRIERDYREALKENARREAAARELAGRVATQKRLDDVPEMAADDPGALRDWLRERDPKTK